MLRQGQDTVEFGLRDAFPSLAHQMLTPAALLSVLRYET
jgi:hypothetical protein